MGILSDIYSASDTIKRRMKDFKQDPKGYLQMVADRVKDSLSTPEGATDFALNSIQSPVGGAVGALDLIRLSKQNLGKLVTPEHARFNLHAGPGLYGGLDDALVRKMYLQNEPWWVGGKTATTAKGKNVVKNLVKGNDLSEAEQEIARNELGFGGLRQYLISLENLKKPLLDVTEPAGRLEFKNLFGVRPPVDSVSSEIFRTNLPDILSAHPNIFDEIPYSGLIHPSPGSFKKGRDVVVYERTPLDVLDSKLLVP